MTTKSATRAPCVVPGRAGVALRYFRVEQHVSTWAHGYSHVGRAHFNPLASLRDLTNVPEPLVPKPLNDFNWYNGKTVSYLVYCITG